ncbi:hypothetical protein [Streptomyces jumonjinensis]|uniref:Ig-like domain-containing protein n=1 Tax=Streptomyces jumonjinensis TaxID=1945 RepID=A0A646KDC1_STRJU|nr:hypothetical protein [Streptomyces jumonjinensis]MQT00118.1 hypothetical protein [Streptomyces jumonjinensis]
MYRSTSRRIFTAVFTAAAVLGGGVIASGTAVANPGTLKCSTAPENTRDLDLPGQKPDTKVIVENCAEISDQTTAYGNTTIRWQMLVPQAIDQGKRFTSFKVTSRLESRPTPTGTDTVEASVTCDFTAQLNASLANSTGLTCGPSGLFSYKLYWSIDSTIVYDLEGDGAGPITWQQGGSPLRWSEPLPEGV